MRLLKQKSRVYLGKAYYKHWIVIPNKNVKKLGWKQGATLSSSVKNGKLIIGKEE